MVVEAAAGEAVAAEEAVIASEEVVVAAARVTTMKAPVRERREGRGMMRAAPASPTLPLEKPLNPSMFA